MEPTLPVAAVEAGPVYFFDQMKTRLKERDKKIPEELYSYFSFLTTDLHPLSFTPSLMKGKNPSCTGECTERHKDDFLNDDSLRKEKHLVLHEMSCHCLHKATAEDANSKVSQTPSIQLAEEDSPLNMLHTCVTASRSQQPEEKLQFFANETGFPQGVVNMLTCDGRELTEETDYNTRCQKSLVCRSVTSRGSQALKEADNGAPISTRTWHESSAKENNAETASSVPLGDEAPVQNDASQSPATISFSLSSKICEERGWICQPSDSSFEDPWKLPYVRALKRLQQIKKQIKEQISKSKEASLDKPVSVQHHGGHKEETSCKTWKGPIDMTGTPELLHGKRHIPVAKKADSAQRKLHYKLNDGSSLIYYPSGCLAVCQSYCSLPGGGMCTNIFSASPDHSVVGTFTPYGHGSICLPSSNTVTMLFNQEGGLVTNRDEEMAREWKWPRDGKLAKPVIIQVNDYMTVRIAGRFAMSLIYKWQRESVCLSLCPRRGAVLAQLEESPKLTELLKKYEVPKETLSHVNDVSAARELRKLQRKIQRIVKDWLEHYGRALDQHGIDSTHTKKMFDFPLRFIKKCKIQSADALSFTSVMQRSQGKRKQNSQAPRASDLIASNTNAEKPHMAAFHLSKRRNVQNIRDSRFKSQTACPAVLRRIMMGEEGKTCRCSNRKMPHVSDLEYDHLINNQMPSKEQIIVICVSSSLQMINDPSEDELEQLYERKNKNRSMPCAQSCLDSFRLLKYDISSADAYTDHKGSLLVERHNVAPGMFLLFQAAHKQEFTGQSVSSLMLLLWLRMPVWPVRADKAQFYITFITGYTADKYILMYIQGKLLFANYIFNGYSKSTEDLQKQMATTRSDYRMGYCLPSNFRFRNRALLFDSQN